MAKKLREALTDDDILRLLNSERVNSLGYDDEVAEDRARSLDYVYAKADRGYVQTDLPADKGLSQAVSSDVHDAIETVLPDLIDIFTAGDDVVAFEPQEESDEEQAQQETDYLNHVFYKQNDGWKVLYTAFKDALTSKLGVVKWWWETCEEWDEFVFEDKTPEEIALLKGLIRKGQMEVISDDGELPEPDPITKLTTFRARQMKEYSKARVAAIPPEDFFIDRNATGVRDAMVCGHKARVRAYELVSQGFDYEKVTQLRDHAEPRNQDETARDYPEQETQQQPADYSDDLARIVEIIEYHAWIDDDGDGKVSCWKIITGNDDTLILDKEPISSVQYATGCPYPVTHKAYGRSLADLLIDIQKVKTALLRMMLNHAYFSINPRPYVDVTQANQYTLSDLHENRPGRPVRGSGPAAVTHLPPPALGFDPFAALEYVSTMGETRTGVVRNAQGLNPDTLHDTAKGMGELMAAAQRKTRMIARILAETLVKDMFLGLHDLIVRHANEREKVRLRNREFVEVDPNKWDRRKDLNIAVGLGSNTRQFEFQFWSSIATIQQNAAEYGLVDPKNFFNAMKKLLKAGGERNAELYFIDPDSEEGRAAAEQVQQKPDPKMQEALGKLQLQKEEMERKAALEEQRFQFEAQLALLKTYIETEQAEKAMAVEAQLEAMAMERQLAREDFKAKADAQTKTMSAAISAKTKADESKARISNVKMGGKIG